MRPYGCCTPSPGYGNSPLQLKQLGQTVNPLGCYSFGLKWSFMFFGFFLFTENEHSLLFPPYTRNQFAHAFPECGGRWLLVFNLLTWLAEETPAVVPVVFFHLVE